MDAVPEDLSILDIESITNLLLQYKNAHNTSVTYLEYASLACKDSKTKPKSLNIL